MKKYLKETAKYLLRCPLIISPYVVEIEKMYGMTSDELNRRNEEVSANIQECLSEISFLSQAVYRDWHWAGRYKEPDRYGEASDNNQRNGEKAC